MARTEKRTKIRGLPPKVSLTLKDSVTGSYPPVLFRTIGETPTVTPFNDQMETITFSRTNVYYGLNLPTGSQYISSISSSDLLPSMTGSGFVQPGISDVFLDFPKYKTSSSNISPFVDSGQFASDGKSQNLQLFASGTELVGFGSPLWSKQKIEINLSTAVSRTLGDAWGPAISESYTMAYYNHGSASWQPVGSPRVATYYISQAFTTPSTGITPWYREKAIGFGPFSGIYTNACSNMVILSAVRPFKEHGFPFAEKYFVPSTGPSSSILYSMSNKLQRPFLLEAIAVQFTGSFSSGDLVCNWSGGALGSGTSFFFILNQRKNGSVSETITLNPGQNSFPANVTASYTVAHNSGTMDIVGCLPIFTPGTGAFDLRPDRRDYSVVPALQRNPNVNIIFPFQRSDDPDGALLKWSGQYVISGVICAPTPLSATDTDWGGVLRIRSGSVGLFDTYDAVPTFPNSRNGSSSILGNRNFLNSTAGNQQRPVFDSNSGLVNNINGLSWILNPYILYPSDQLIFGWQSPHTGDTWDRQHSDGLFATGSGNYGAQLTIAPGFSKVVLYGTYLQEGHEYDSGFNQVVFSNSIHEAIE
jgi:hypothetical protein